MRRKLLLIILFLNLLLTSSQAATEFVCNINGGSPEDYNTLTLWEAAMDNAGNLTDGTVKTGNWDAQSGTVADATAVTWDSGASSGTLIHMTDIGSSGTFLVDIAVGTLDDNDIISDGVNTITVAGTPDSAIIVAFCYNDDGILDDFFNIDGFTTNTTNYVKVTSPVGERHNGIAGTGFCIDPSTSVGNGGSVISLGDTYCIISWLEIKGWTGSGYGGTSYGISAGIENAAQAICNNIIHDPTTPSSNADPYGIQQVRKNPTYNNLIYNVGSGIGNVDVYGAGMEVFNNTVYNFDFDNDGRVGITTNGTGTCYNNLVIQGTYASTCYTFGGTTTHTNNGSSDTTGEIDNLTTAEFTSVSGGSENLHLVTGATSIDAGTDLGTGIFSFDIDNRDRDASGDTWDIGADEYVSAVTGYGQVI